MKKEIAENFISELDILCNKYDVSLLGYDDGLSVWEGYGKHSLDKNRYSLKEDISDKYYYYIEIDKLTRP